MLSMRLDHLLIPLSSAWLWQTWGWPSLSLSGQLSQHWTHTGLSAKIALTTPVLSIHASTFLITALSVARYWVLAWL